MVTDNWAVVQVSLSALAHFYCTKLYYVFRVVSDAGAVVSDFTLAQGLCKIAARFHFSKHLSFTC